MSRDKFWDAGVTAISKVRSLPRVRVGFGEGRGIPVTDVVHGVDPGKVQVESVSIVFRDGWEGGFVLGSGSDGRGGLGCQGGAGGGSAYPM